MQVPPKVMFGIGNSVRRSGAFVVRRGLSFIVNGVCIFFILGVRSWTGLMRTLEPEEILGDIKIEFLSCARRERKNKWGRSTLTYYVNYGAPASTGVGNPISDIAQKFGSVSPPTFVAVLLFRACCISKNKGNVMR